MTDLTVPQKIPSLVPTKQEENLVRSTEDMPFLPTLKLIQGLSKEREQGIPDGNFYIVSKDIDAGKEVEIAIVGRRAHALLMEGNKKTAESFDPASPLFQDISSTPGDRAAGIVSFSGKGDWLLYLPKYELFVTYFCGRPSSRPLSNDIINYVSEPKTRTKAYKDLPQTDHFTLYSHFETKAFGPNNKCWVPKVKALDRFKDEISAPMMKRAQSVFYLPVVQETKLKSVHPS